MRALGAGLLILLAACGNPGAGGAKATPQTPEALAEAVVATLRSGDAQAFLALCSTRADHYDLIDRAQVPEADKRRSREKFAGRNWEELEEDRAKNFQAVHERTQGRPLDIVEVKRGRRSSAKGVHAFRHLIVELRTGPRLTIDLVFKTSRGWVITDDAPLRVPGLPPQMVHSR